MLVAVLVRGSFQPRVVCRSLLQRCHCWRIAVSGHEGFESAAVSEMRPQRV